MKKDSITFVLVQKYNLSLAIETGKKVFPKDSESINCPEIPYRWSVYPEQIPEEEKKDINFLEYYLAYNHDNLVGITGLYRSPQDPKDTCWMGWFGVVPEFRSNGYGKIIIDFTEKIAFEKGFHIIKLWTTKEPDEAIAQLLFEKMRYEIIDSKKETVLSGEYEMIIRSKKIFQGPS